MLVISCGMGLCSTFSNIDNRAKADVALWLPGLTNLSAMVDQPMMGICPFFGIASISCFSTSRGVCLGDPEAARSGIHGCLPRWRDVKGVGQDDVGIFRPTPGSFQLFPVRAAHRRTCPPISQQRPPPGFARHSPAVLISSATSSQRPVPGHGHQILGKQAGVMRFTCSSALGKRMVATSSSKESRG